VGKKSGSGFGMKNPYHISESLKQFFGLKDLNSFIQIRDPGWKKIRIRDEKIRIQDKRPGSATLVLKNGISPRPH
jgi:hypothetical protein